MESNVKLVGITWIGLLGRIALVGRVPTVFSMLTITFPVGYVKHNDGLHTSV